MSENTPKQTAPARATAPAPEWPKYVQTTIQPTVTIAVEEAEWTDLSRQGLLVDDTKSGD